MYTYDLVMNRTFIRQNCIVEENIKEKSCITHWVILYLTLRDIMGIDEKIYIFKNTYKLSVIVILS